MSLKISKSDKKFMDLAISLAEDRVGLTGSNPSVGCVIVNKSQIISVGQTGIGGTPHAETVAIKSAKKKVFVFRVFAATTRYMDFRPWSAICTFIKHKIAREDIKINSNREIMRGVVCM